MENKNEKDEMALKKKIKKRINYTFYNYDCSFYYLFLG